MVAALRRIGFQKVFDTDFGADLTIMEEAHEFIERVKNGGTLPMITSCSPGWVKFCEHLLPGASAECFVLHIAAADDRRDDQTWFAQKEGIDPSKIVVVSIMPCTAKKFEIHRDDMEGAGEGIADTDIVLTTRELARLIKLCRIDSIPCRTKHLTRRWVNPPVRPSSSGSTGGVMEAALRTAADTLEGRSVESIEYQEVRGGAGIKEAVYKIARHGCEGCRCERSE